MSRYDERLWIRLRTSIAPDGRPAASLSRRWTRTVGTLVMLGLVLGACATVSDDADPVPVTLEVRPDAVAPGDPITLALENHDSQPVGYNLCTSTMERLVDVTWRMVPSSRVCTLELRILAPDEVAYYSLELEPLTDAGTYRISTTVEYLDTAEREIVRSTPFEVLPTRRSNVSSRR